MDEKVKGLPLIKSSESQRKASNEVESQETLPLSDLVQKYQNQIVNTCYGFLHNFSDAEDAAQEVFLKAWKALPAFRGECKLSTWLYRIACRSSLDILRKRKREKSWNWILGLVGLGESPGLAPAEKDPLVVIEQRERAKLLMAAIDNLPDSQRQAYVLATFEHLKGKEIAQVIETTPSAVESLLVRARKNLRRQLEHYYNKNLVQASKKEEKVEEGKNG